MEQRFSTKKLMSVIVVIAMLCSSFAFMVPASAESTNILAGMGYDLSGCGERSSYNAKLTDGLADSDISGQWFGFYCNGNDASVINAPDKVGYAIVDLGGEYTIDKVRTNVTAKSSWGIPAPEAVNVYFSADGEAWGEANAFTLELVDGESAWLELSGEWTANFIKFEYVLAGTFAFTNEIEAYGVAASADDDTSDDPVDPDPDDPDPDDPSDDVTDDPSDDVTDDPSDDVTDDPSDDVTDDPSDDVTDDPEPPAKVNIALNKEYTTHEPLGGYDAKLTDGVKYDAMAYSGDQWFCFKSHPDDGSGNLGGVRTGTVIIDLAGSYDITGVMINAIYNDGAGVSLCSDAKVYLSDDGETWGEAISLTIPDGSGFVNNTIYTIEGEVIGTANFVKVELTLGDKTFLFFNEIEVYGIEAAADDDTSDDDTSSDDTSSDDTSSDDESDDDDPMEYVVGDVDGSGEVDSVDYLLVKRAAFGNIILTEGEYTRANVMFDDVIDSLDYILVKRIAFGTYVPSAEPTPEPAPAPTPAPVE